MAWIVLENLETMAGQALRIRKLLEWLNIHLAQMHQIECHQKRIKWACVCDMNWELHWCGCDNGSGLISPANATEEVGSPIFGSWSVVLLLTSQGPGFLLPGFSGSPIVSVGPFPNVSEEEEVVVEAAEMILGEVMRLVAELVLVGRRL